MSKGDCYEANALQIIDLMKQDPKNLSKAMLCHGKVLGKSGAVDGEWFGHAWIEIGDCLIDFSNGKKIITRKEKVADRIDQTTVKRYTPLQTARMLLKTEVYGPWTDDEDKHLSTTE